VSSIVVSQLKLREPDLVSVDAGLAKSTVLQRFVTWSLSWAREIPAV
jgi:hypothetical protein